MDRRLQRAYRNGLESEQRPEERLLQDRHGGAYYTS
jgi:hypothetical protein